MHRLLVLALSHVTEVNDERLDEDYDRGEHDENNRHLHYVTRRHQQGFVAASAYGETEIEIAGTDQRLQAQRVVGSWIKLFKFRELEELFVAGSRAYVNSLNKLATLIQSSLESRRVGD